MKEKSNMYRANRDKQHQKNVHGGIPILALL